MIRIFLQIKYYPARLYYEPPDPSIQCTRSVRAFRCSPSPLWERAGVRGIVCRYNDRCPYAHTFTLSPVSSTGQIALTSLLSIKGEGISCKTERP